MLSQLEKCIVFADLHKPEGAWVIPNPWDVGSAKILASLGFKALATTSGGFAFTQGLVDGKVSLEQMLQHCSTMCAAISIPVSADFENGFSDDSDEMAKNILRLATTGVAGFSIEDFSRDAQQIYPLSLAVERIQAATEAIKGSGIPIVLTARAEGLLHGQNDYEEIVKRLQAFSAAGADVLFAPAIRSLDKLQFVTSNLDKPFNALARYFGKTSVQQLAAAGAKRISVGGALTYASVQPLLLAGTEMIEQGTFNWIGNVADSKQIKAALLA